ncbi:MAG: pseudouridine synthase [Candidatus Saccharimonadales bacterium]
MRVNKFVALATGISRRAADAAIIDGRVLVDGKPAQTGEDISSQAVTLDGKRLQIATKNQTILLNKPAGYVVSRNGQGGKTVYDLLPQSLHHLKPIGRLDKDSSGLLLLTSDGSLAHELTHPRFAKQKVYEVRLDKPLASLHRQMISEHGIQLDDGPSKFLLERLKENDATDWRITMHEGRNRQIRRTFAALGYKVKRLHRTTFGSFELDGLAVGEYQINL